LITTYSFVKAILNMLNANNESLFSDFYTEITHYYSKSDPRKVRISPIILIFTA